MDSAVITSIHLDHVCPVVKRQRVSQKRDKQTRVGSPEFRWHKSANACRFYLACKHKLVVFLFEPDKVPADLLSSSFPRKGTRSRIPCPRPYSQQALQEVFFKARTTG